MSGLANQAQASTTPSDLMGAPARPAAPPVTARPPAQAGARPPSPGTDPASPEARQAQAELGSVMAEGAGTTAAPPAPGTAARPAQDPNAPAQEKPVKGTEAASVAEAKEKYANLDDNAKKAELARLKKEGALFSTDKMKAGTDKLTPEEAAEQRVTNARELMIQAKALGVDPSELGLDPGVVKAAGDQQKMVDDFATQGSKLPKGAQEAAALAARMREENKGKPQTKEQRAAYDELLKKNGLSRAELDKLPAEQRLLIAGFSPDEIADHFTARDKDADVISDPANPGNNTAKRGDTGGPPKDGDKNMDGTVRRPMTTAEADRTIDMNAVLDESWHAAGPDGTPATKFGKIIDQDVTKGQMDTSAKRDPALYGDVGEVGNTDRSPSGQAKATGTEQIQAAGLDYNTSKYVSADGKTPSDFVKNDKVHRVEGDVNASVASNAEVCLGAGVYARAQQRAAELEATKDTSYIPKMLRTDKAEDAGDSLPGMMMRPRGEAQNNGVPRVGADGKPVIGADGKPVMDPHPEMDPRTGLGYSVTERADMGVIPNQERKMRNAVPLSQLSGVQISRSDTHEGMLELDPATNRMVPKANLTPEQRAYYDELQRNPSGDVAQGRAAPTAPPAPSV